MTAANSAFRAQLAMPHFGAAKSGRTAARAHTLNFATVAPPADRMAPVWDRPVPIPPGQRRPAVWLLGAHGGAGVSTIAQLLSPAADCYRRWPGGYPDEDRRESPYVALVARETLEGLTRAQELLCQYHCGLAGEGAHLIGLITCAHQPGRPHKSLARFLDLVNELVPETGRWRIDWQDRWPLTHISDLPTWNPGDDPPADKRATDPLKPVRDIGTELITAIRAIECPAAPTDQEKR